MNPAVVKFFLSELEKRAFYQLSTCTTMKDISSRLFPSIKRNGPKDPAGSDVAVNTPFSQDLLQIWAERQPNLPCTIP
jgi:hypothetical protein